MNMDKLNLHFITVIWGKEYTDTFITIVLPNLISSLNIPAFHGENTIFKIYTTEGDAETIKYSLPFQKLSDIILTQIEPVIKKEQIAQDSKYNVMTDCHKIAVNSAYANHSALIFISPDAIFSEESFSNLLRLIYRGKKLIMIAGLRVIKEEFIPVILKHYYSKQEETIRISSRNLVRQAMKYLHPISRSCFWDSTCFFGWPSHLYFRISDEEGMLARCFHLHPIFVNYQSELGFSQAIDGDYISKIHLDNNAIHIVEDSDEILCIEMSKAGEKMGINCSSILNISAWARLHANRQHRMFFQHKIYFHTKGISSQWKDVEIYSDKIVKSILLWLKYGKIYIDAMPVILKMNTLIRIWIRRLLPQPVKDGVKKLLVQIKLR